MKCPFDQQQCEYPKCIDEANPAFLYDERCAKLNPKPLSKALFSSKKDNWRTPKDLFDRLNAQWHFTIDGAADSTNHLCERWWGLGSEIAEDALSVSWADEVVWLNPPYSKVKKFMWKAWSEYSLHGTSTVALVPARTDTQFFHQYVYKQWGVKYEFIKGRLKFLGDDGQPVFDKHGRPVGAPFPSMLVYYGLSKEEEWILRNAS